MNKHALKIRKALKEKESEKGKLSFQRFFKDKIKCYGVKTSDVSVITKQAFEDIKDLSKLEVFEICEELYKSGYEEEAWIAAGLAYRVKKYFKPSDFKVFEKWVKNYIDDWAKCDGFCNHTMGYFVETYPKFILNLKKWSNSKNRWVKRASAVSLILPTRQGKFLKDVFEIADILLMDKDDMVQKGYGWLLKETCKKNEKLVYEYVLKHREHMPRTALRYAIEKMPKEMRVEAMKK